MKALILAAGYAIGLRPLTLNTPKPLLEVGTRRILDWIVDKLRSIKEIGEIFIITNQKFFERFEEWRRALRFPQGIRVLNDGTTSNETRLGAIKDIGMAIEQAGIEEDLLIIAGDNLFELDLRDFIDFARARRDGISIALHNVGSRALAKRYGVVELDEKDKRVVSFAEKPERPKSTLISTCIYYFPKERLKLIDEYIKIKDRVDAPGHYIKWLQDKYRVYGFVFDEDWYDIGDIDSYNRANQAYARRG